MKIKKESNVNYELCAQCGGRCCKNTPGMFASNQIKDLSEIGKSLTLVYDVIPSMSIIMEVPNPINRQIMLNGISNAVNDNKFIKKKYDELKPGEILILFGLEPRLVGETEMCRSAVKVKEQPVCEQLAETGCKLSLKDRPLECVNLVPKENFACGGGDYKFQSMYEILNTYEDKYEDLKLMFKKWAYNKILKAKNNGTLKELMKTDDIIAQIIECQWEA